MNLPPYSGRLIIQLLQLALFPCQLGSHCFALSQQAFFSPRFFGSGVGVGVTVRSRGRCGSGSGCGVRIDAEAAQCGVDFTVLASVGVEQREDVVGTVGEGRAMAMHSAIRMWQRMCTAHCQRFALLRHGAETAFSRRRREREVGMGGSGTKGGRLRRGVLRRVGGEAAIRGEVDGDRSAAGVRVCVFVVVLVVRVRVFCRFDGGGRRIAGGGGVESRCLRLRLRGGVKKLLMLLLR